MSDTLDAIFFDERVDDRVRGWFSVQAESGGGQYRQVPIEISIGTVALGYAGRNVDRPDVDAVLPHHGQGPKGFSLPLCALFVFARLCHSADRTELCVRIGDRTFQEADFAEQIKDPELLTTFRASLKGETMLHVVDLWLAASATLRLRLDEIGPDLTLRFYQAGSPRDAPAGLVYVGEARRLGGSDQILDIALANPLAPLLITMFDSEDFLVGADVIPFPSLCRGGTHAAELAALGPTGDSSADLRIVGGYLLVELLSKDLEEDRLSRIVVDARTATGAEAMFSAPMMSWLRGYLGLEIQFSELEHRIEADRGDPSAVEHLQSIVHRAGEPVTPRRDNNSYLAVAANAVPTISALVTRRLWEDRSGSNSSAVATSLIVDGAKTGTSRWFVRQADQGQVAAWSDRGPSCFPLLVPPSNRTASSLAKNMPLAILAKHGKPPQSLTLIHPSMGGISPSVPVSSDASPTAGISVLVVLGERCKGLDTLLASLASQNHADDLEIIIHQCGASSAVVANVTAALESSFPGHYQIHSSAYVVPRGVAYEVLARTATKPFLLFIDEWIVLHDNRTLDTLLAIAVAADVGTASCMILAGGKDAGEFAVRSAGYLPGRLDYTAGSAADVAFVNTFDLIGPSTYTVVANTSDLMLTKRDLWLAFGAASTRSFPRTRFDVDYGIRMIEAGKSNVVTTTISAVSADMRGERQSMDLHAPFLADIARMSKAFASSLIARRL